MCALLEIGGTLSVIRREYLDWGHLAVATCNLQDVGEVVTLGSELMPSKELINFALHCTATLPEDCREI